MPKTLDSNGLQVELVPMVIRFTKAQRIKLQHIRDKTGKPINEIVRSMVKRELQLREDLIEK
jgi:hypothetical protein